MPLDIERLASIPSMSGPNVARLLYDLGRNWRGAGVAVEVGSWLGYSCAATTVGLVEAGYDRPVYCFDRFRTSRSERAKALASGVRLPLWRSTVPIFERFVKPFYAGVVPMPGAVERRRWNAGPIELFILDSVKTNPAFARVLRNFGPAWIPGTTVVVLMDFHFHRRPTHSPGKSERIAVQKRFVERYRECFEPVADLFPETCVAAFRYREPIDFAVARID